MDIQIRTYTDKTIALCEHIAIQGEENDDDFPRCEYKVSMEIDCKVCNTTHTVTIAVN